MRGRLVRSHLSLPALGCRGLIVRYVRCGPGLDVLEEMGCLQRMQADGVVQVTRRAIRRHTDTCGDSFS